jgi:GT2 family glycosyltransferase
MPPAPGEDATPTVSAIIITRNRKEALAHVLDRLHEQPVGEILVVDNGSSDGTAELVRGYGARVRFLEPGANLGLAGRNLAAKEATGELLLMLDDDAYPLPGAVETLLDAFAANPRLGVAGGLVRDVDSTGRVLFEDELGTFDWWLRAGRTGEAPPEGFPAFSFPEGACMIRREAYAQADGFFEPYFLTNSEVDLTARLRANDWEVRYFPSAAFDHMKAEAERQTWDVNLYYRVRNHLWYIWLRFPTSVAVRRTIGYLSFDLLQAAYHRTPSAWWRGVRDAWLLRDRVHGERRPLPRSVLREAELNRGRMHVRLLVGQLTRKLWRAS